MLILLTKTPSSSLRMCDVDPVVWMQISHFLQKEPHQVITVGDLMLLDSEQKALPGSDLTGLVVLCGYSSDVLGDEPIDGLPRSVVTNKYVAELIGKMCGGESWLLPPDVVSTTCCNSLASELKALRHAGSLRSSLVFAPTRDGVCPPTGDLIYQLASDGERKLRNYRSPFGSPWVAWSEVVKDMCTWIDQEFNLISFGEKCKIMLADPRMDVVNGMWETTMEHYKKARALDRIAICVPYGKRPAEVYEVDNWASHSDVSTESRWRRVKLEVSATAQEQPQLEGEDQKRGCMIL